MMKKLIIGLGTGRCGSLSLSYFLSNQPGMKVLHEGTINQKKHIIIKWEKDQENLLLWIDRLEKISEHHQYWGDIGMYFLPYVSFIISRFPNVRFICLKRKREQVVKSFLKWSSSVNLWYEHDGTTWNKHAMDAAFPKFNEPDKAKAIGFYWDMYYEEIDRLIAKYPQNIRCFSIESLNSISGRNEILDFVEYQGQRKLDGDYIKHKNTGINYLGKCCLDWAVWNGQRTLPKPVRHWLWRICGRHLYYLFSEISEV